MASKIFSRCSIQTPWGSWQLEDDGEQVIGFEYWPQKQSQTARSDLAREVQSQVNAYFSDGQFKFDLPLAPKGTDFQQRVWQLMIDIPAGEVISYGVAASQLQSAARAVGGACRANPIPLIIPCHRIVAKRGIGGFSGDTDGPSIDLKRRLLIHEGALSE